MDHPTRHGLARCVAQPCLPRRLRRRTCNAPSAAQDTVARNEGHQQPRPFGSGCVSGHDPSVARGTIEGRCVQPGGAMMGGRFPRPHAGTLQYHPPRNPCMNTGMPEAVSTAAAVSARFRRRGRQSAPRRMKPHRTSLDWELADGSLLKRHALSAWRRRDASTAAARRSKARPGPGE